MTFVTNPVLERTQWLVNPEQVELIECGLIGLVITLFCTTLILLGK